jgi:hypothetical protein
MRDATPKVGDKRLFSMRDSMAASTPQISLAFAVRLRPTRKCGH